MPYNKSIFRTLQSNFLFCILFYISYLTFRDCYMHESICWHCSQLWWQVGLLSSKGSWKSRKMLELFMKNCILISNYTDESTRRKWLSSTICWLKLKEQLLAVEVFSVSCVPVNQVENLSFNRFCARNLLWTLITSMNAVVVALVLQQ